MRLSSREALTTRSSVAYASRRIDANSPLIGTLSCESEFIAALNFSAAASLSALACAHRRSHVKANAESAARTLKSNRANCSDSDPSLKIISPGPRLPSDSTKSSKMTSCACAIAPRRRSSVENVRSNAAVAAAATSSAGSHIAFTHADTSGVDFSIFPNPFPHATAMRPFSTDASRRHPTSPSPANLSYARAHGRLNAANASTDFLAPPPPRAPSSSSPSNSDSSSSRSAFTFVDVDDFCAHRRSARATSSSKTSEDTSPLALASLSDTLPSIHRIQTYAFVPFVRRRSSSVHRSRVSRRHIHSIEKCPARASTIARVRPPLVHPRAFDAHPENEDVALESPLSACRARSREAAPLDADPSRPVSGRHTASARDDDARDDDARDDDARTRERCHLASATRRRVDATRARATRA